MSKLLHSATLMLLLAASYTPTSLANSSGIGIPACDARSPLFGCKPDRYSDPKDRFSCLDTGNYMNWALSPVRTNIYQMFSGLSDDISKATNTYTAGGLTRIHIAVTRENREFRGVMIQARNNQDQLVGTWKVPKSDPNFHHPGAPCPNTLFHANADLKPMVTTYYLELPADTTGDITVEALIKYGDANTGHFFYPNRAGPLVLKPATSPSTLEWVQGAAGQSCDEVCSAKGKTCNEGALRAISSASALDVNVGSAIPCRLPMVAQCVNAGIGPTVNKEDVCYFFNQNLCPSIQGSARCGTKSVGTSRICACGEGQALQGYSALANEALNLQFEDVEPNDYEYDDFDISDFPDAELGVLEPELDAEYDQEDETQGESSTASRPTSLFVTLITCWFFSSPSNARASGLRAQHLALILAAFLVAELPRQAQAHNWVESMAREFQANTRMPCTPRTGNTPHVQVAKGQEFEVEWVTGHGDISYFAIVKAEDESKLAKITTADLAEYIRDCPASANYMDEGGNKRHWKFHRKSYPGVSVIRRPGEEEIPNFFDSVMQPGDPDYSPRDQAFIDQTKSRRARLGEHQFSVRYKAQQVRKDARCAYTNAKWPFLIEVSAFDNTALVPVTSTDAARFRIGRTGAFHTNTPPGDYVVWFKWRGFGNCVDVQLVGGQQPVQNIYGTKTTTEPGTPGASPVTYSKVDHCTFRPVKVLENRCVEVVNDLSECQRVCEDAVKNGEKCDGIQVVPLELPDTVAQGLGNSILAPFSADNQPLVRNEKTLPWCRGRAFIGEGAPKNEDRRKSMQVCYAIEARKPTDTIDTVKITDDPQNPVFYGTCLKRTQGGVSFGGDSKQTFTPSKVDWLPLGGRCMSCSDKATYETRGDVIPFWLPQDGSAGKECFDCDANPGTASTKELAVFSWDVNREVVALNQLPWRNNRQNNMICQEKRRECPNAGLAFKCMKPLVPRGARAGNSAPMKAETCYALAERDGTCDKSLVFFNVLTGACRCYRKAACCGTCVLETSEEARGFRMFRFPGTTASLGVAGENGEFTPITISANGEITEGEASGSSNGTIVAVGVVLGCVAGIALFAGVVKYRRGKVTANNANSFAVSSPSSVDAWKGSFVDGMERPVATAVNPRWNGKH